MPANIQLFVSCHKPGIHVPANELLRPIQVGARHAARHFDGMLHDDEGVNISLKNSSYCELTGQYWAWKNVLADYYGFLHYRRYFNFSKTNYPEHHEPFIFGDVVFDRNDDASLSRISFNKTAMRSVIEACDFIAPTPIATPDGANVYDQYRLSVGHHIEDFDLALDIIERFYPQIWPSAQRYLDQNKLYVCNMFVMRKELFNAYSTFLFDVLGRHEQLCDASHYTAVGRRVSGYLGERLCGIYLTYLYEQGYKGRDLQRVYFRDTSERGTQALPAPTDVSMAPLGHEEGLSFGSVTRGGGKIYTSIAVEGDAGRASSFRARSTIQDGQMVPAKVVRFEDFNVLVLPVLDVDQTANVEFLDERGAVLASGDRRYAAKLTMLESKKNTLLHDRTALAIRNCDCSPLASDVRVTVDRIMSDVDGTDIVQGTIRLIEEQGASSPSFLEVLALGALGRPVSLGDWVCLGDKSVCTRGYSGYVTRVVTYSLRVPRGGALIVWARFPGKEHQDGFACVESFVADDLRNGWQRETTPAADCPEYDHWFRDVHRTCPAELSIQRRRSFTHGPVFSIIVPLYKTPLPFFRSMADSVIAQTYAAWQLVLVNASPEDGELAECVREYLARDSRITCVTLKENLGITENTNEGIKAATGDFLCFFDHDDVLEPDALYWYADAVEVDSQIDLLYCDEDKLMGERYVQPFFKPEWNPDLLLAMNYVCHFLTVRKSIVDSFDLPTREYDGSQDYHMTFRVGEKARHIRRIPRVLYHWRVHEHSTALRADQKDYALETSRLAVQTHLNRCGIRGAVADSTLSPRRFFVEYDLDNHPLVSIVVPNKDAIDVLARCITSIRRHTTYDNWEIVIVENNSECSETFTYYRELEQTDARIRVVTLQGMMSFNFSRIINFGVSHARGDYLLLLNNDTQVITPNWIERLLGPCIRSDVGATGAKLLFPDGTIQHAGITCGFEGPGHLYYRLPGRLGGNFEATLVSRDMMAVTGACLLTRRDVFDEVGGMEEELAVNYNDVDYCLKVGKAGYRIVFCPEAQLYHHESVSRGDESTGAKALRFRTEKGWMMKRWPELYEEPDPFDNPNLIPGNGYAQLDWRSRGHTLWAE